MKTFQTALICTLLSGVVAGQQDIQFTQILSNPYLVNVGAGGMSNVAELSIGTRAQWLSVEGNPVTYYASGQSQIRFAKSKTVLDEFNTEGKSMYNSPARTIGRKHIIGGKAFSDAIGPFSRTNVSGSYAIHMPLTDKINIGLGIGLGLSSFSVDNSKVTLSDPNDGAYISYISFSDRQGFVDAQSGLVLYNDKFYIGISGTQLLKNSTRFEGVETESTFDRHFYFVGSYRFDFEQKFALEPVVTLKNTTASPLSVDAGLRLHYYRMGWLSVGYRGKTAFSAGFGFNVLKNFRVAYAYEMGIAGLRSYGSGTHEIQLGMVFGRKRNVEKELKEQEKERLIEESDELKPGTE
jgi:type IX secretion system PorP/SprF family membrane protein